MTRTLTLTLATVAVVTSAAMTGLVVTDANRTENRTCSCSTVDLESGSVTLAVLSNGTESTSVSQQVSQVNDHTRVRLEVAHGDTSVEIAGETVANGSLVLNVTRDGEVVTENVVANASETLVFRLESDGVRITKDESDQSACPCESVEVDDEADGVSSDVEIGSGDTAGHGEANDDSCVVNVGDGDIEIDVGNGIELNLGDEIPDAEGSETCANPSMDDSGAADIPRADRTPVNSLTDRDVFRVVVHPNRITGLAGGIASRAVPFERRSPSEDAGETDRDRSGN